MGKAPEQGFGKIMGRARLAAVVPGGDDACALGKGPAVVDKALQNDLEDDGLGLLGRVCELIKEQNMLLPVPAEALQADQPGGLDVDDLVFRFVVNGAAVDGFRRFVDQLYIQGLRVDLPDAVALAVAGKAVDKDRDIRVHIGADQAELVVAHHFEARVNGQVRLDVGGQFPKERSLQISRRLGAAEACKERHAADK